MVLITLLSTEINPLEEIPVSDNIVLNIGRLMNDFIILYYNAGRNCHKVILRVLYKNILKKFKKPNISQDHYLVRCDWRSFHHKMYKVNITITRVYSMYGYDAALLTARVASVG